MFKIKKNSKGSTRPQSPSDSFETASSNTSLSDSSSVSDVHDLQQDTGETSLVDQENVGLSNERMTRQRPMLDLVDRLRSFGLAFELGLPQIVAVGMQNVGKSSLIEGICGIKLPRDSGTCTRCPIEIRMKRSSGLWKCDVSLQIIYDEEGMQLGQSQTIEFGGPIFDRHEVEDRVKSAHRAILSPSVPPRDFLGVLPGSVPEITFSKNYISILVQGPDVSDLSFVDLPGLLASSRQGNSADIKLIEDLVVSYIRKPSTLILLTVACESDFYTQGAYQLVTEHDREGTRTVGVFTKPDRIAKGDEERWLAFIKNDELQLDLGWWCVKQPDINQLKERLSWEDARNLEKKWFDSTTPWNQLPAKYSKQLGTLNLVEKLGDTLANLINFRLPLLREEIEDLLRQTEKDLSNMPAPPSEDSLYEMMHLITSFCSKVSEHTEGIAAKHGLLQSINEKQDELRRSVLSLAPEFKPYTRLESAADLPQIPPCEFLDGEEIDREAAKSCFVMYVDEVMDILKRSRTRELPDYFPYEVPKQIIGQATRKWGFMVHAYFDGVWDIVSAHFKKLVEDHFKYFETGGLLQAVHAEIRGLIQKHREQMRERLDWILHALERPFTLNTRYMADYKRKFFAYYKAYRFNVLNHSTAPLVQNVNSSRGRSYVGEVLSALNKMDLKDVKATDIAMIIPDDEFEPALRLMADVSAYFQVASKRFIDVVPAIVDYDFVLGVSRELQSALYAAVINGDPRQKCSRLLQEAPHIATRRAKLQRKHERLEAARDELLNMPWCGA